MVVTFRHLARIAVMQTLFAYEFHGGNLEEIHEYTLKEFAEKVTDKDFCRGLLKLYSDRQKDIAELIQKYAPEWPLDKIAPIDRAILEIGTAEVMYSVSVPPVVAINEAIEIAKEFGDYNSPKFVNGVLSSIMNANCSHMDVKKSRQEQNLKISS